MTLDCDLLRRYAEFRSEDAFAELVRRHVNLVHSAALRQVNGDAHMAQDVSQSVFTDLARKAAALSRRPSLAGWLFTSTHFAAAKAVRKEKRRQSHEREALAMRDSLEPAGGDLDWEKVRPVLDSVMQRLKAADREVILMRYFENREFPEMSDRLGLSEDAVRKRVERALDRLRLFLCKRGITTGASLAGVLSASAVQTAPAGLAATLTTASLTGALAGAGSTLLFELMAVTKLKLGIASTVAIVGLAVPLVIQHRKQVKLEEDNVSLQLLGGEVTELAAENERLSNLLANAEASLSVAQRQSSELLKLRGEVGLLRRLTNELSKLQVENQQARTAAAKGTTASAGSPGPATVIPIIVMDDAHLTDAVRNLARMAGRDYTLEPMIRGPDGKPMTEPTVSLRWTNLTAEQALNALLEQYGFEIAEDAVEKTARLSKKDLAGQVPDK
jgi:RNA polymerase sigma factor (sigma-70 family)